MDGSEILHLVGFDDFDANTAFYLWVIVVYFYIMNPVGTAGRGCGDPVLMFQLHALLH
jgi:hypothetical protein